MKKATAILFLFVFMLTTAHISEFFKLNRFVKHYTEHIAEEPGMSMWEFITMHYMNGDVKDDDYKKDLQLPFKDLANQCHTNITLDQPVAAINLKPDIKTISKNFELKDLSIPTNNYTKTIWQPPRA